MKARESTKSAKRKEAERPAAGSGRWFVPLAVATLILVSLAAYYPALNNTFHLWDDDTYITANERVQKGLSPENAGWAFSTTYFGFYYPMTWLSHMADVQMFGLNPKGHYFTSIALHAANAALLFLLLFISTGSRWRSLFAAGLFSLHPMNVESVVWLAERKNLLSAFFLLLALISYVLKYKKGGPGRHSFVYTAACYIFFILGLMSKSSIVVFPFLLLLLDFWPLGRVSFVGIWKQMGTLKGLVLEKLPFAAFSVASGILTIVAQKKIDAISSVDNITVSSRIGEAFLGFGFYLQKLFVPTGLGAFYAHHNGTYPVYHPLIIAIVMCALTVFFFSVRKRSPVLLFGWLFFIVSLLPVIGIIQAGSQAYADRYAYFSYWGLFVMIVFGFEWKSLFEENRGVVAALLSAAIMIPLFSMTRAQIRTWKDDEALFGNITRVSPASAMGYLKLGNHYFENASRMPDAAPSGGKTPGMNGDKVREFEKAIDNFTKAVERDPGMAVAYYDKACALSNINRHGEAVEQLNLALDRGFDAEQARSLQFSILRREWTDRSAEGKWDEAEEAVRKALSIYPEKADVWCFLGFVMQKRNDIREAESAYSKALSLDPTAEIAVHNLALLAIDRKDSRRALELLGTLEKMNSRYAPGLRKILSEKKMAVPKAK